MTEEEQTGDIRIAEGCKSALECGNFVNLIGDPDKCGQIIDTLSEKVRDTHLVLRVSPNEDIQSFNAINSDLIAEASLDARKIEGLTDSMRFSSIVRHIVSGSDRPVILVIEKLQDVSGGRDDLIRSVRLTNNQRPDPPDENKFTVVLSSNKPPYELQDNQGTPYNVGENFYL
jgi:hypothetical protein